MENLRLILKALFLERKPATDNGLSLSEGKQPQRHINEQLMVLTLREMGTNYTLDQLNNIVQLTQEKWMKAGTNAEMQYSSQPTVFNILLHFSANVLHLMDGEPISRYEMLLRWHDVSSVLGEDLFVLSYLASRDCQRGTYRHSFLWDAFIGHDNSTINVLFNGQLVDLHTHLFGSSFSFSLNWLSLMNNIYKRYSDFDHLGYRIIPDTIFSMSGESCSLQLEVVKAAAIRFYLISQSVCPMDRDRTLLMRILETTDINLAKSDILQLQDAISAYANIYGYQYQSEMRSDVVDYAISQPDTMDGNITDPRFLLTVLSGERYFMYTMFHRIYSCKDDSSLQLSRLFYAYLLIKAKFRQEFVQLNNKPGFANFANYQERKMSFTLKSIYNQLNPLLATGSFFYQSPESRYLETRISPQDKVAAQNKNLQKIDEEIHNTQFVQNHNWNYHYILHFIKSKDKTQKQYYETHARHFDLRKKVAKQADVIYKLRYEQQSMRNRVVGIDAASSEIACRPEVFAQAFRYLREHSFEHNDTARPQDLGITYHVGEDYLDVVDGLRAVDETLRFMNFGNGDRIGHALVLGENVQHYYECRSMTVVMPQQMLLDNMAWLYVRSRDLKDEHNVARRYLLEEYEEVFRIVYATWLKNGNKSLPPINTYYQSWLLRGDNPERYRKGYLDEDSSIDRWSLYALNTDSKVAEVRKYNKDAMSLYADYHYNKDVKVCGKENRQWKLIPELLLLIDTMREEMLSEIERFHISIECNPTSNLCIGALLRYDNHPITKFFNYQLRVPHLEHALTVSINTDDKGVFSTSLEREYSLMAIALEKHDNKNFYNSPRQIYDWLERIRQLGTESKFKKGE